MKILMSSHFFHPSVGGIEEVGCILAQQFTHAGHDVKIVTQTADDDGAGFPFSIYRRPGMGTLLRLVKWCDVFFHNNLSLRTAWPLLVAKRPWIVAHHTWFARADGTVGCRDRLKHFVVRAARNIAVSEAVRLQNATSAKVIGNPYRDDLFRVDPSAVRDRDLVFVGRLVRDKGVDILFQALADLRKHGLKPRLTVIGQGPEEAALRQSATQLGLDEQIVFAGLKTGAELVSLLNRHRVIVVPSRWREPFGLVAVEGIACGCMALVANCGGLPDAIGRAGAAFRHKDAADAASWIARLLEPGADLHTFRDEAATHLARHSAGVAAAQYLRVMEEAMHQ